MTYLLKLEWLKVKNHTPFWVFIGLFVFSNIALILMYHFGTKDNNQAVDMLLGSDVLAFPKIWHTAAWFCSWALFLLGLYIITNVSNETSFKTHRQNIIDGTSRANFVLGKWLMVLCLAIFATLVYVIITLLYVAIFNSNSFSKMFDENWWFVGYYFVQCLSYLGLATCLSMVLRKTGLSIVIYLVYVFIIDNLLFAMLGQLKPGLGRFMLIEASDSMIDYPFRNMTKMGGNGSEAGDFENPLGTVTNALRNAYCLVTIIYISLYIFFSNLQFKKSDL